jgi:hypothetical protein
MSTQASKTSATPLTYATAVTQFIQVGTTRLAYRRIGKVSGVPYDASPIASAPIAAGGDGPTRTGTSYRFTR